MSTKRGKMIEEQNYKKSLLKLIKDRQVRITSENNFNGIAYK